MPPLRQPRQPTCLSKEVLFRRPPPCPSLQRRRDPRECRYQVRTQVPAFPFQPHHRHLLFQTIPPSWNSRPKRHRNKLYLKPRHRRKQKCLKPSTSRNMCKNLMTEPPQGFCRCRQIRCESLCISLSKHRRQPCRPTPVRQKDRFALRPCHLIPEVSRRKSICPAAM